jgi:tetratricopeptide (TPR) repeat protein
LDRGRYDVAERELRQAIAIYEQAGVVTTHGYAAVTQNLGVALARLGRHAEAEPYYRQAYELHRRQGGEAKPAVADCLQSLALARAAQGAPAEAIALHEQVLALRTRYRPGDFAGQIASHAGVAEAALAAGDLRRAALADAARADLLDRMPDINPSRAPAVRLRAGRLFLDAGDPAAATPLLQRAFAFCSTAYGNKWPHGEAASLLAECRLAAGDLDEALELATTGARLLATPGGTAERRERAAAVLQRVRAARAAAGLDAGEAEGANAESADANADPGEAAAEPGDTADPGEAAESPPTSARAAAASAPAPREAPPGAGAAGAPPRPTPAAEPSPAGSPATRPAATPAAKRPHQ